MSEAQTAQPFGWAAFTLGAIALGMGLVVFWAGPFAPQQAAGVTLGELAAEIAKSAARAAVGQDAPPPAPVARDLDDYLNMATGLIAGLAIILGLASFIRHEAKRAALAGIALGGLAIGFQLLTWGMMLVAGALVLAGLSYALRDAFGEMFGGLLGG